MTIFHIFLCLIFQLLVLVVNAFLCEAVQTSMNRTGLSAGVSVYHVCYHVCLTRLCLCSNKTMEDGSLMHICKCTKEMGELVGGPCNLNWHTAGDDRPTNPPPKLEVEFYIFPSLVIWSSISHLFAAAGGLIVVMC